MTRLCSRSWRWFVSVALCAGILAPLSLQAADPGKGLSPEDYRKHAMTRNGDVKKGEEIFAGRKALCSQCHSTDGSNRLAGPDLKAAGDKFSREDLILSVLQPSSSIMTGFALSVVTTRDGSKYSGVVKESSSQELVIAGMGELRHRIAKEEIKEQVTSPVSMMPANLHAALSKAEFTDLVTYLESLKDERSKVRNERGTPLEILRLEKPVRLVPFLGDGLELEKPVWFGEHPVINDRFVILEKSRARISLLERKPDGPATRALFVEIPEEVYVTNDEGLLGMAFHPNFAENRRYYFMHEVKEGARRGMVIGEREARADLMADSGKPTRTVLEFDVATEFHHGGGLEFGPDGYLYIGMGDGGPQEDPHGQAQDLTSF